MVSASAIEKHPEVPCGECPDVADSLDLAEPRRSGAWDELVQNGVPQIDNNTRNDSINLPFFYTRFTSSAVA